MTENCLFLKKVDHDVSPLSQTTHETLLIHLATMTPTESMFHSKSSTQKQRKTKNICVLENYVVPLHRFKLPCDGKLS